MTLSCRGVLFGYLLRQEIRKDSRRVEHGLSALAMEYGGIKSRDMCDICGSAWSRLRQYGGGDPYDHTFGVLVA